MIGLIGLCGLHGMGKENQSNIKYFYNSFLYEINIFFFLCSDPGNMAALASEFTESIGTVCIHFKKISQATSL